MKKRMAILVMMAKGCRVGRNRVFEAIKEHAPGVDTFASLDGVKAELPSWVSALHPPAGTRGIVRPTKWCVTQLAGRYEWLLRLTWDACLGGQPNVCLRDRTVYGMLRPCRQPAVLAEIIRRMGEPVPKNFPYQYVDGYAILAQMEWWSEIFCALPADVTHYKDDSVSSVYGAMKGWRLENHRLAIHRHQEWRK